jgi:carbon storage regulator
MLVLTRKTGQAIRIGDDITIRVIRLHRNQVQIGIDAPSRIAVYRQEIYDQVVKENVEAAAIPSNAMEGLQWFQAPAAKKS